MIGALNTAYENGTVYDNMSRADYYALSGIVAIEQSIAKNNREEPCLSEEKGKSDDCMPLVIFSKP